MWTGDWKQHARTELLNTPWSSLRALGQSKVVALTILIPFIGWLIIFNQQVLQWLNVMPVIVGSNALADKSTPSAESLSRLYWTYFGLLLLGLASFLFQILCPTEVRKYADSNDYVEKELEHTTDHRARQYLVENASTSTTRHHDYYFGAAVSPFLIRAYPDVVDREYERFIQDVWHEIDGDSHLETGWDLYADGRHYMYDELGPVIEDESLKTMMDTLKVADFIGVISSELRVHRGVVLSVLAKAPKFKKQTLSTRYAIIDYSKPIWRMTIHILFLLGFISLFWPSVKTILGIIYRAFLI